MSAASPFLDSNVILYLLSTDARKADRSEALVGAGAIISVQVLNEVANVARRKLMMTWAEVDDLLGAARANCKVEPLTTRTHDEGIRLARELGLSFYDAMIAASALLAGCKTLYSEDMHDSLLIDKRLTVRNPFR